MRLLTRRPRGGEGGADPDAIWRGEIPDDQIVMTAAERARIDAADARHERRRMLVDLFGEPVGAVSESGESLRHHRRGDAANRQGNAIDQRRTAGCREEIQVSVLAHPVATVEIIADGGLLDHVDALSVDSASEQRARQQIAWDAWVRTTPWSSRPARLRLYGSPSSNVTVLTLTPQRTRRFGVRLFLRAGLSSLFVLRDAVEHGLDRSGPDHSGRT